MTAPSSGTGKGLPPGKNLKDSWWWATVRMGTQFQRVPDFKEVSLGGLGGRRSQRQREREILRIGTFLAPGPTQD